jgi:hypothetical protein
LFRLLLLPIFISNAFSKFNRLLSVGIDIFIFSKKGFEFVFVFFFSLFFWVFGYLLLVDGQSRSSAIHDKSLVLFSGFSHQLHPWEPLLDLHSGAKDKTFSKCVVVVFLLEMDRLQMTKK